MRRYAPHHTSIHSWHSSATSATPKERALSSLKQLFAAIVSALSYSQPTPPPVDIPCLPGHPNDDVYAESRLRALRRWLALSTPLTPEESMALRMLLKPGARIVRAAYRERSNKPCAKCRRPLTNPEGVVGGGLLWQILCVVALWSVYIALIIVRWITGVRKSRKKGQVRKALEYVLGNADCYASWYKAACLLDEIEAKGWRGGVCEKCGREAERIRQLCDVEMIVAKLNELGGLYRRGDLKGLAFALRAGLVRNLGGMCHPDLYRGGRVGSVRVIEDYVEVVSYLVAFVAQSGGGMGVGDRLTFLNEARHAYGRTALMLSGGAAMGLNHLGVVKGLLDQGVLPKVVCGTSAGALVASMVGIFDDEDLGEILGTEDLINPLSGSPFSFRYFDEHVSWIRRLKRLVRKGYIQDVKMLQDCLRKNYGDLTFEEAYNKTHRILNITVCPLRSSSDPPLLLNYLTAPHVLIWSAAAASCALPLVFAPVQLVTKSVNGRLVPYHPDGVRWIDGSISSDVPLARIGELFNVNHFIVSQTNPHVIPRSLPIMHTPLALLVKSELQFRYWQLLQMQLVPKLLTAIFPHFMQPYAGDVTIMPDVRLSDLARLLSNPTPTFISAFIRRGEIQTFPFLDRVRLQCLIERTLDTSVEFVATAAKAGDDMTASPRRAPMLFGRVPSWLWLDTRSILTAAAAGGMPFGKRTEESSDGFDSEDEREELVVRSEVRTETRVESRVEAMVEKRRRRNIPSSQSTPMGGLGVAAADELLEDILNDLAEEDERESDDNEYKGLSDGSDESQEEERALC